MAAALTTYPCDCLTGALHTHTTSPAAARARGVHAPALWLAARRAAPAAEGLRARSLADAIEGALWGAVLGDALAAPTHWIYNYEALVAARGPRGVAGFAAPPAAHPGSWAYFSRADPRAEPVDIWGGAGAGAWAAPGAHYHGALRAGDNTLTARLLGALATALARDGALDARGWLRTYARALVAPSAGDGAHNDTWTDETHRVFFRNVAGAGAAPHEAGMEDACLSSLVLALPALLGYAASRDAAALAARAASQLTHKSAAAAAAADAWGDLLATLLAPYAARGDVAPDAPTAPDAPDAAPPRGGLVLDALAAACETLSEGRTDLRGVLARGLTDDAAFFGENVVFSSR